MSGSTAVPAGARSEHFTFDATLAVLKPFRGARIAFVPNPGNAGDAAITYVAYCLLDRAGLRYDIAAPADPDVVSRCDVVLYSGGGNLVPYYDHALTFLEGAAARKKKIVVLPHTIFGCTERLLSLGADLQLICRDRLSHRTLLDEGFPERRLHLDHDLAFALDRTGMPCEPTTERSGRAFCLRIDAEALAPDVLIPGNHDISMSWNGYLWHNRSLAWSVTSSLLGYLSSYRSVVTDRLHVALLGALVGTDVTVLANSYYKNREIFEFSLQPFFANVRFEAGGRRTIEADRTL